MILKDLSRSYRVPPEISEPRTPIDHPPEESIVSYVSEIQKLGDSGYNRPNHEPSMISYASPRNDNSMYGLGQADRSLNVSQVL